MNLDHLTDEEREILESAPPQKKTRPSMQGLTEVFNALQDFNYLALPSIPWSCKTKLPKITGVYVLYSDSDVLYVGQSLNIKNRWSSHEINNKLACIPFEVINLRVGWIECPKQLMSFVEIYLIGLLYPVLNIKSKMD